MSWSVDAVIKTGGDDVLPKVKELFEKTHISNQEERSIRDMLCSAAMSAIASNTKDQYLKLEASGSAYGDGSRASQSCRLSVQPVYGQVID
jgi:hypothetical protein